MTPGVLRISDGRGHRSPNYKVLPQLQGTVHCCVPSPSRSHDFFLHIDFKTSKVLATCTCTCTRKAKTNKTFVEIIGFYIRRKPNLNISHCTCTYTTQYWYMYIAWSPVFMITTKRGVNYNPQLPSMPWLLLCNC